MTDMMLIPADSTQVRSFVNKNRNDDTCNATLGENTVTGDGVYLPVREPQQ
jgi:hypothetical protein